MKQPDLFPDVAQPVKPDRRQRDNEAAAKAKLIRTLRAAPKGGLVNGMSKAMLRRYAPAKLPKVTVHD